MASRKLISSTKGWRWLWASLAVVVLVAGALVVGHFLPRQGADAVIRTVSFALQPAQVAQPAADAVPELLASVRRMPATGPLRVDPSNPRYFMDPSGRAVLLTGSHTWMNLQDIGDGNPPPAFDYNAYLDFLVANNQDFFRLWTWEQSRWVVELPDNDLWFSPLPYTRTGPGTALDGGLKFDLTQFNQAYFDRMHQRVAAAGERGIYVSVMLFQGWSISSHKGTLYDQNPWHAHPFNAANNINGISGDSNGDDSGDEVHTLEQPTITALQEAYVRKVIDTVNDLPNVLYEISDESPEASIAWQYHFVNWVKQYEANRPSQHPVGMTATFPGDIRSLMDSQADWISPNSAGKRAILYGHWGNVESPIVNDGAKVILNDTDRLCGICGDQSLMWTSFVRGLNPIFMDPYGYDAFGVGPSHFGVDTQQIELIRRNMGYILTYANRVDLAAMTPRGDLCSTGFCLANVSPQAPAYLVYLPRGGKALVEIARATGPLSVEWFNPLSGSTIAGLPVGSGGLWSFQPPWNGEAVLFLHLESTAN